MGFQSSLWRWGWGVLGLLPLWASQVACAHPVGPVGSSVHGTVVYRAAPSPWVYAPPVYAPRVYGPVPPVWLVPPAHRHPPARGVLPHPHGHGHGLMHTPRWQGQGYGRGHPGRGWGGRP